MNGQQYANLRKIRGLIAFSKRGQAALVPSTDRDTTFYIWNKLSQSEQGAIIEANAAAAIGDWSTAEDMLTSSGFATGIR